jgi:O-methyltransferase
VPGWFQETLPAWRDRVGAIAILRIDGDFYESTRVCFEELYERVMPGGAVVIDDYGTFEGCRRATDEFLSSRPRVDLIPIDFGASYFVKPG